jgi:AcrR family transcriptional regulator
MHDFEHDFEHDVEHDPGSPLDLLFPDLDPDACDGETDRIVAAALAEFTAGSYGTVTLDDVARRAGTTTVALERAFASKEALFREVVRSTLVAVAHSAHGGAEVPPGQTAVDALRAVARRYWSTMARPEHAALLRLTIGELPRFPELAVLHAAETLERLLHELERIIERGIARGELRPREVRAAARTILATLAAHALWFAHPEVYAGVIGPDRERAATATIDAVLRTLE